MVPEIGLGTWKYKGGPEPLRKGIELGATLIDTAEMYKTEDAVGAAIAQISGEVDSVYSLAETSRWTAILGIAVQPPTNADALRTNPLGIFVTSINWSKELG